MLEDSPSIELGISCKDCSVLTFFQQAEKLVEKTEKLFYFTQWIE